MAIKDDPAPVPEIKEVASHRYAQDKYNDWNEKLRLNLIP